jgi:hypothetical protein
MTRDELLGGSLDKIEDYVRHHGLNGDDVTRVFAFMFRRRATRRAVESDIVR